VTVLYLHGFASGPASKKAQFFKRKFAERGIETLIPDLAAGSFESLTLSGQLRVAGQSAAGRPVAVIGSSMGGYLAALYAANHPETTRAVCLAPAFDFANRWRTRIGEEAFRAWRQTGWLPVFHYGENRETRVGYQLYEDSLIFDPYPKLTQPVLVFHGRNDDIVPVDVSEEFARRTPQARLHVVDSGHELIDVLEFMWEETWRFLSR
jgi:hypothetical protein